MIEHFACHGRFHGALAALSRILSSRLLAQAPQPPPRGIDTDAVVTFLASKIAPIGLAVLGVIFIGWASKGRLARVLTSATIALVGLLFIAGAGVLFVFGQYLVDLLFQ